MFAYVPNADGVSATGQTGFEDFLVDKFANRQDANPAFALSNLGLLLEGAEGVEEVVWAQVPCPGGEAIALNVRSFTRVSVKRVS